MMWAELIFFVGVLGLLFYQLYAVKKAQREREAKEAAEKTASESHRKDEHQG